MTTGAISRAKLLSNRHHQQTNTIQCFDTVGWQQEGDPACKELAAAVIYNQLN